MRKRSKWRWAAAGEQHDRQEREVVLHVSKHQAPAGRPKLAASRKRTYTHNLTASVAVLGPPIECQLAAVPAVIAGHRCTRGPFRAQLQRSTNSECITKDLPENPMWLRCS